MKKKAIVYLAFAAALTAVSCQKEAMKEAETTPTGEGMTISAVSEGIGVAAKADLAYKYDVIWRKLDRICVKNSEKSVEFTLTDGEGTTKGTFSSGESISGEVEGFYPANVANLIWPAEQQNNHVPPMYCKKTLSSTQNQTFNFASLGSVLQLTFSTTSSDIVLKSIEVKADEAMSGAFTVENGQAKVSQPEGDKPGITIDLGDEGVKVGVTAKKFNMAVPAGEYNNLTITFIAKDGQKCTKHATKAQSIEYNTVNTLAISGEFKPDFLPGVFTVADDELGNVKKVHFSKGNLWADSSNTLHFEANKYAFNSSYQSTHVSHFTWSSTVYAAVSKSNSGDNLFCDENNKVSVDGSEAIYYALSKEEWQYLFNTRTMANGGTRYENLTSSGITVEGVTFKGVVLFPDDFTDQADWKTKYTTWEALNDAGLVFLPAAGDRYGSNFDNVGVSGRYWSSTAYDKDDSEAYNVLFHISSASPDSDSNRILGISVRLITEVK